MNQHIKDMDNLMDKMQSAFNPTHGILDSSLTDTVSDVVNEWQGHTADYIESLIKEIDEQEELITTLHDRIGELLDIVYE